MSYIKLQIRSGGIYIRQNKDYQPIDLDLIPHPAEPEQKVLPIVRDSAIKGLFSYLIGETKKIKKIEDSSESSIKKLNLTLDRIVEVSGYKKQSEPHVTVFFERRDVHTKNIISPSSISLQNYSIKEAESTIRLLEKPITNIMGQSLSSLSDIHSFFKKDEIKSIEENYEKLRKYILKHLQKYLDGNVSEESKKIIKGWKKVLQEKSLNKKGYGSLKLNMQVLLKKNTAKFKVPEYDNLKGDFISKLEEKLQESEEGTHIINELKKIIDKKTENENKYNDLKPSVKKILEINFHKTFVNRKVINGFLTALNKIIDEKPISSKVPVLIDEICRLYDEDSDFAKKIKGLGNFQFSSFTNLGQTKAWIHKQYYPVVRGAPAYIACVDFDVYLSESNFKENNNSELFSWEEIVNKLKAGPNIARWGEGGVVFVDYSGLDEMGSGYDQEDQMFIDIKSLRHAGMKIKKYNWETTEDEKKQPKK